jgi:hypothetical protein
MLLCFVYLNGIQSSILFFTGSEKCIDTRKDFSAGSVKKQSMITAELANYWRVMVKSIAGTPMAM